MLEERPRGPLRAPELRVRLVANANSLVLFRSTSRRAAHAVFASLTSPTPNSPPPQLDDVAGSIPDGGGSQADAAHEQRLAQLDAAYAHAHRAVLALTRDDVRLLIYNLIFFLSSSSCSLFRVLCSIYILLTSNLCLFVFIFSFFWFFLFN